MGFLTTASWTSIASFAVLGLALFADDVVARVDPRCGIKSQVFVGPCKGPVIGWSWDPEAGICKPISIGAAYIRLHACLGFPYHSRKTSNKVLCGCEGAGINTFLTLEECLVVCAPAGSSCTAACEGFPGDGIGQQLEQECLTECNDCIDDCNLEQPPNDGIASQIKQECVDECVAVPTSDPGPIDEGEVPPAGNACADLCDGFPGDGIGQQLEQECLTDCNDCIDDCNLEQPPNDGIAQQIKQECVDECVAVPTSDPGPIDEGEVPPVGNACAELCDGFPGDGKGQQAEQKCIQECEECVGGCSSEGGPNDGKAQQLEQQCIAECLESP